MSTDSTSNPPLKRCTKCHEWFPCTQEYFYRHGKKGDGLRPDCKACKRKTSKKYISTHKEERREYERQHREQINKTAKIHRQNNPEIYKAYSRKTYYKHRDKVLPKMREYHRLHPKKRAFKRIFCVPSETRMKRCISIERYRSKKRGLPFNLTLEQWQDTINYFNGCCAICGRRPGFWHTLAIDHWIPITDHNCPGTIIQNVIPLCQGTGGCNNSKCNRNAAEWLTSKYGKRKAAKILKRIQGYFDTLQPS